MSTESTQSGIVDAPRAVASSRGKGFLAVCGSLFLHGAGHVIAGRYRRALFWFALSWGLVGFNLLCAMARPLLPLLIVLIPLSFLASLWCLIDSYLIGRSSKRSMLPGPALRYLAGVGIVAAAAFLSPAVLVVLPIRAYLVETFRMPTVAMSPTLMVGDRFMLNKRASYGRWSIVVIDSIQDRSVKYVERIVGLPGETVEVIDGEVVINGKIIPRPQGIAPYRDPPGVRSGLLRETYRTTLGMDEYFLLGDNSQLSADSRFWRAAPGHQARALPSDYIMGSVTAIYWPPQRWRRFE